VLRILTVEYLEYLSVFDELEDGVIKLEDPPGGSPKHYRQHAHDYRDT
jgi:hypothetical protein